MPNQDLNQSIDPKSFYCECDADVRSACIGQEFYRWNEDKRYCVLHYPGSDKSDRFQVEIKKKLNSGNYDFSGVQFPEDVDFKEAQFSNKAIFYKALFVGDAYFYGATFHREAIFKDAVFKGKALFHGITYKHEVDFKGAYFSREAYFHGSKFQAVANFGNAIFNGEAAYSSATFEQKAYFHSAIFRSQAMFHKTSFNMYTNFSSAIFEAMAYFDEVKFETKSYFIECIFNEIFTAIDARFEGEGIFKKSRFVDYVYFDKSIYSAESIFEEVVFEGIVSFFETKFLRDTKFTKSSFLSRVKFERTNFLQNANFDGTTFLGHVSFSGENTKEPWCETTSLGFQFASIEKPDKITFYRLNLQPQWFINVDCRKFEFMDVEFNYNLKEALRKAKDKGIDRPHSLLAITYRQLADNAEANHRYIEASKFRYASFEIRRIEEYRRFVPGRLDSWYWIASGYGENVSQAFGIFALLVIFFAGVYTQVGFEQDRIDLEKKTQSTSLTKDVVGKPLQFLEAAAYSVSVSILQKPDPKPLTLTAKAFVIIETILGPAQAALLALAIRRRFMR
jgi:uncharacterized protein YjbI with pentapeptide repeats